MGLMSEPWYFNYCSSSVTSTITPAVSVTAGSSGAEGTSVSVISALAHDVHYLMVAFNGFASSIATDKPIVSDILIDPAGGTSWSVLINNLACRTALGALTATKATFTYHFPIFIKAGSSIGVQSSTSHATGPTGQVYMWCFGEPNKPEMWWCGSGVETLGITGQNGVDVTPGSSGTAWGSWTTIGTSTFRYGAVQFGVTNSDATAANTNLQWELGYSSVRLPGSPTIRSSANTSEQFNACINGPIFCCVPANTTWQARGLSTGSEAWGCAVYGVY